MHRDCLGTVSRLAELVVAGGVRNRKQVNARKDKRRVSKTHFLPSGSRVQSYHYIIHKRDIKVPCKVQESLQLERWSETDKKHKELQSVPTSMVTVLCIPPRVGVMK